MSSPLCSGEEDASSASGVDMICPLHCGGRSRQVETAAVDGGRHWGGTLGAAYCVLRAAWEAWGVPSTTGRQWA